MQWLSVVKYILARTREPTIVHRGVQAVGGLIAAWALTGPERWIGLILSVSALIGILMPDATSSDGWNDASQEKLPMDDHHDDHPSNRVQRMSSSTRSNTTEAVDRSSPGFGDRN